MFRSACLKEKKIPRSAGLKSHLLSKKLCPLPIWTEWCPRLPRSPWLMWEVVVWVHNLLQGGDVMFNAKFVSAASVWEAEKWVWFLKICLRWNVGGTRPQTPRRKSRVRNIAASQIHLETFARCNLLQLGEVCVWGTWRSQVTGLAAFPYVHSDLLGCSHAGQAGFASSLCFIKMLKNS